MVTLISKTVTAYLPFVLHFLSKQTILLFKILFLIQKCTHKFKIMRCSDHGIWPTSRILHVAHFPLIFVYL